MQNTPKSPAAATVKNAAAPAPASLGPVSDAQQTLRDMPEVDSQRIAELKAAVSQGTLDLDVESLSRSMMDYYRR